MGRAANHRSCDSAGEPVSLIIFFGMALFIFIGGCIAIGVTIRHWIQQSRAKKAAFKGSARESLVKH